MTGDQGREGITTLQAADTLAERRIASLGRIKDYYIDDPVRRRHRGR